MRFAKMRLFVSTALVVTSITVGSMASADSLREALRDAYINSDLLEQNRQLLRLKDEGVAQQLSGLRPIISFVSSARWDEPAGTETSTIGLTLDLLLFDNGSQRLAVEAARETVLATRQDLVDLEQSVLLNAVTGYMNVWRDIQIVAVFESNVRVITEQLRAAEDRFEVGEDTRTDVAQAQSELATARSNLAGVRGNLEISRELFLIAVGREAGALLEPTSLPSTPASEAEADNIARQNHPSILSAQHEITANEINLGAAQRDYGPSITLRAETNRPIDNFGDDRSSLTLNLTQPIYRGGQLASLERSAIATLAASRFGLNQQVRIVIQSVGQAYARLRIANAQIQASEQRIRAAQLAFEGVSEEASLGARTTLDVLDAEQDLLDARISRIEAQASLYTAGYTVLSSTGLLTVEQLDLAVPSYDPTEYYNAVSTAPPRSLQGDRLDSVTRRLGRD
jgi:outer membrane protein